ncbi:hypothetical protein [Halomicrococcus gelatinilyticus]|uniref:hypothetical protein n=1 Tax=Halomicrococcus gelatinilyticus TaxID=1702103 RepID=UPI002E10E772
MSRSDSTGEERTPTYAVQFVLEVDDRAFADALLDEVPDADAVGVEPDGHRTYVDETALGNPAVGASIPFDDRRAARSLYESVQDVDGMAHCVESGTLAIREYRGDVAAGYEPRVLARTGYPRPNHI